MRAASFQRASMASRSPKQWPGRYWMRPGRSRRWRRDDGGPVKRCTGRVGVRPRSGLRAGPQPGGTTRKKPGLFHGFRAFLPSMGTHPAPRRGRKSSPVEVNPSRASSGDGGEGGFRRHDQTVQVAGSAQTPYRAQLARGVVRHQAAFGKAAPLDVLRHPAYFLGVVGHVSGRVAWRHDRGADFRAPRLSSRGR